MKRDEILRILPEVYRRTSSLSTPGADPSVLDALLGVMERMHAPVEHVLANLDDYFDPRRASDDFIPFLAAWMDMDGLLVTGASAPPGLFWLRNLILSAAHLSKLRGTKTGLEQFLQLATGMAGFQVVTDKTRTFHVTIQYPPEAEGYRDWMEKIIEWEKPAYVTFDMQPSAGPSGLPEGVAGLLTNQPTLDQPLGGLTHDRETKI